MRTTPSIPVFSLPMAWIGVGKMGQPMAGHLLSAGAQLLLCDPDRERLTPLLQRGAQAVDDAAAAAARVGASGVVFSSLPNDAALREVVFGTRGLLAGAQPGMAFVDTSTVSPTLSAEVAGALQAAGVQYLRVTVSGNNHFAESATLTVMASGDAALYARLQPLLACFGDKHFHVGTAEQARTLKLVINLMIAGTAGFFAEALALGRKGGLDWQSMLQVIGASAVASPIVRSKSQELAVRDFTPTFTCHQMAKDLDLILAAGQASGVPLGLTALVAQLNQACIAMGDGELDYIATVRLLERLSGLALPPESLWSPPAPPSPGQPPERC